MTAGYVEDVRSSLAASHLSGAAAALPPIELPALLAVAELQTRLERKYLVPAPILAELLRRLPNGLLALEIDGRRAFAYESVYFDTPELLAYRHHVQGNRHRFKVRTRTYVDSGDCMLEVKVGDNRSRTVKHRMPYPAADRHRLTAPARAFIAERIHWPELAGRLTPSLTTAYHRTTLVDLTAQTRLTCDVELTCRAGRRADYGLTEHVLIETKAADARALCTPFRSLGIRPVPLSKYCLAVAMLADGVPTNPWHRTLRRYFGWSSPAEAARAVETVHKGR